MQVGLESLIDAQLAACVEESRAFYGARAASGGTGFPARPEHAGRAAGGAGTGGGAGRTRHLGDIAGASGCCRACGSLRAAGAGTDSRSEERDGARRLPGHSRWWFLPGVCGTRGCAQSTPRRRPRDRCGERGLPACPRAPLAGRTRRLRDGRVMASGGGRDPVWNDAPGDRRSIGGSHAGDDDAVAAPRPRRGRPLRRRRAAVRRLRPEREDTRGAAARRGVLHPGVCGPRGRSDEPRHLPRLRRPARPTARPVRRREPGHPARGQPGDGGPGVRGGRRGGCSRLPGVSPRLHAPSDGDGRWRTRRHRVVARRMLGR